MKVFAVKLENLSIFLLLAIIAIGLYTTEQKQVKTAETMLPIASKVVILDAGHGGWDPGKNRYNRR